MNAGSDWPSSRASLTLKPSRMRRTLNSTRTIQQIPREIAPGSSRSCRREKNAKAKRAGLKLSRSLSDGPAPSDKTIGGWKETALQWSLRPCERARLRTHFRPAYCIRRLYGIMAHFKNRTPFSTGFFTVLQGCKRLRQQLMALENKFNAIFPYTEANWHESHSNSGSKTAIFCKDYVIRQFQLFFGTAE